MLATSLIVVRKMLEAVAGSAPSLLSVSGIGAASANGAGQHHGNQHHEPELTGSASPCSSA